MEKKAPARTCIACRKTGEKKDFIRIVKSGEEILIDKTGKINGRGAYVCKDVACIEKVKKNRLINRVFKTEVKDETYEKLAEAIAGGKE